MHLFIFYHIFIIFGMDYFHIYMDYLTLLIIIYLVKITMNLNFPELFTVNFLSANLSVSTSGTAADLLFP